MFKKLALAATLALTATFAHAADIAIIKKETTTFVHVTGKIELYDGLKFKAVTRKLEGDSNVVVMLTSPGGSVIAGLTIGYTKIGMHSEGMKVAHKGKVTAKRGDNKERIAYFVRLGLSKEAIIAMITPNPDSMMWLNPTNAVELGIEYKYLGKNK